MLVASEVFKASHNGELALAALLHDAHEAYTGDMVRPLKRFVGNRILDAVEGDLTRVIRKAFGVTEVFLQSDELLIRMTDKRILLDEKIALFPNSETVWDLGCDPLDVQIYGWMPEFAAEKYLSQLQMYSTLMSMTETKAS